MKRWTLQQTENPKMCQKLAQELGVQTEIAQLLINRGISTFNQAKSFFRPDLTQLHDPFLMQDMLNAVERIELAISKNENILVYGDYDVDGTTSVTLMYEYLTETYPNVTAYIPDRYKEGYGVSYQGIDYASDNSITLIIALDCGIKAVDKVKYAKDKGIDFIICDHHRPGQNIPNAVAVLDPKRNDCQYPYKELCGCGVGFKLIQALQKQRQLSERKIFKYLDLVAIAIGSDIVPITGENRILCFYGLKLVNARKRLGIKALLGQNNKKVFSITDLVFGVGPRINAAGRMKHGLHAVELLSEKNEEKAKQQAFKIEEYNTNRQTEDRQTTIEALAQIEAHKEANNFTSVVYQDNWHKGVIGIVASRLTETYYRPTLVFTKSGNKLAASARSVSGFDVYNALEQCNEFIEQFGGHKYAAGLTLKQENYQKFKQKFEDVVKSTIDKTLLTPQINFEQEIKLKAINFKLIRILKQFAPFGPGNMKPTFYARNLKIDQYAKTVGAENKHLKCKLIQDEIAIDAIGFNLGVHLSNLKAAKQVEAVFTVEENEWNNQVSIQLNIKDIRPQ
ncbi:single-stranded-DNA-specific exonuclease RecJ [Psychroflexus sp. ALD_RP9]|uniref:single-stranded-DNA-specific exonuclease RecJ n=1 Tax=Psychroflexus sp. ALD_RP9 TaxID=2777186 RepID=UPI001A8EFCA6|nr:single-stranded-DNA-specific exonuclease RecJ [Psychroflexus sp. ALD_RP9]QSS97859.1 single-stranded-DNA-specific exonuclease RecJ [Psychroflexus sp. ALD_RP9]